MKFQKTNTVALVIDIQEKLFPVIAEKEMLVNNAVKLISGLSALKVPVVVTEQYTKGLGHTIEAIKVALPQYAPIEKLSFSAVKSKAVRRELDSVNCKSVILFGLEAHICVLQTAIDFKELGYSVIVVEDCISSRSAENKRIALKRLEMEGIFTSSVESILFELCETAEAEQFKEISRLIK